MSDPSSSISGDVRTSRITSPSPYELLGKETKAAVLKAFRAVYDNGGFVPEYVPTDVRTKGFAVPIYKGREGGGVTVYVYNDEVYSEKFGGRSEWKQHGEVSKDTMAAVAKGVIKDAKDPLDFKEKPFDDADVITKFDLTRRDITDQPITTGYVVRDPTGGERVYKSVNVLWAPEEYRGITWQKYSKLPF